MDMLEWIKNRIWQRKRRKFELDMLDFIELYLQDYVDRCPGLILRRFKNMDNHHVFSINTRIDGSQLILFQSHYKNGEFYFTNCTEDERLPGWRKELLQYDIKKLEKMYLRNWDKYI